jgi:FtsP/CotA-like multicopper oxidase with cupredoxin domain
MHLNRRELLKLGAFGSAALLLPAERVARTEIALQNRIATSRLPAPFSVPLTVPPVLAPLRSTADTDFYAITQQAAAADILPGLKTTIWGYNGITPGPTIVAPRGRKTVVRHVNALPGVHPTLRYTVWTSTHLHGSASLPQFDGYASDITHPNQFKDYRYPNFQEARTLWYHDHGVHHTAENVWHGLAGQYHISDALEQSLPIPKGEYDVPLIITDALFNKDGSLLFTLEDDSGIWGDVILVNGRPWPVMQVERRKYRFRILGAAISRSWKFALDTGDQMAIIATDGGLMPRPQYVRSFRAASSERYEVVIDFAKYPIGKRVVLQNQSNKNNRSYLNTNKVMAFDVVANASDLSNNSVPAILNPDEPTMALQASQAVQTRKFLFAREHGEWTINGKTWKDVERSNYTYTLAKPKRGDVEIWEFRNTSGGWFHPVHVHLIDFKILSRNGQPPMPHELGPKDVVYVGENEVVRVLAQFNGCGKYMIHCHNLVHEDHDMMGQFEVVDPEADGDDPLGWGPYSMDDEPNYPL